MEQLITGDFAANGEAYEPKTLVDGAYRQLRRDIIEGRHPPGTKLRVEHLKDAYEVGAGTLREALALLVSDSLVVAQGQRGFRVAPISLADIEDITRTRVMLECEALRQSITNGDETWEGNLVSAFHLLTRAEEKLAGDVDGSVNEWEERNRVFHETLIGACTSRWTRHFLAILYRQSERYRRISVLNRPVPQDVHEEHEQIFKAAIARDADEATRVLSGHIWRTFQTVASVPQFAQEPASRKVANAR
ncbi:MAG: FCD domain-containing protein [Methyloversatilis discipulorum]|uniref:GntR family transcriptional regulator n=1 Tax=Methyloversatilis discipulorum TaxID=1119528 RepID=UPI0026F348AD|nr:FCD domain-containing protein [Methyloversatilis discipulorum]MBV5286598.1 FCD domain-containing protein [Methyloversatilis discipulorum]